MTYGAHSARRLTAVFAALLGLAGLSLALRFARLGDLGLPVALVIATAKAVLVVVFFMELFLERATARLALLASVTLVVLLLLLTVGDVLTRGAPPLDAPPGAAHRDRG